ncbi:tRNA dihydrouridine synthase [Thermodesulfobacteriota bacterium]
MSNTVKLPWKQGHKPLMLAPMQGLTNRALRGLFIEKFRPDVVFTEFIRVRPGARKNISDNDLREISSSHEDVPLVVQLIGRDIDSLTAAAETVQELGCSHLNINLGCPFGRMTGNSAGGALLREPSCLPQILGSLRNSIHGSFSVKVRAGFEDSTEIYSLLDVFAESGVDYLIIHPRTVKQRYAGGADHRVTEQVVSRSRIPVIANGDIFTTATGRDVLTRTGAAGLMLGRGAISDPFLFERLRGNYPAVSSREQRGLELREYLQDLLSRYQDLFCGEHQILCRMKEVLCQITDPDFSKPVRNLKKCKRLEPFTDLLAEFA